MLSHKQNLRWPVCAQPELAPALGVPFLTALATRGAPSHHSHPVHSSGSLPRPQDRPCPASLLPQSATRQPPRGLCAHTRRSISPAHRGATSPACVRSRHTVDQTQPQSGVNVGPEQALVSPFSDHPSKCQDKRILEPSAPTHRLPAWPSPGLAQQHQLLLLGAKE